MKNLVFYFAGHGLTDPLGGDDQLLLALTNSGEDPWRSLSYESVRRVLVSPESDDGLGNAVDVEGSYVLSAVNSTSRAMSPTGETYTGSPVPS